MCSSGTSQSIEALQEQCPGDGNHSSKADYRGHWFEEKFVSFVKTLCFVKIV